MTAVILLSICLIGLVMLAMSVGAIFSNRCLRGSCGGPDVLGADGQALNCGACPHRPGAASAPDDGRTGPGGTTRIESR